MQTGYLLLNRNAPYMEAILSKCSPRTARFHALYASSSWNASHPTTIFSFFGEELLPIIPRQFLQQPHNLHNTHVLEPYYAVFVSICIIKISSLNFSYPFYLNSFSNILIVFLKPSNTEIFPRFTSRLTKLSI